jgi:hypothetical protein
VAGFALFGFRLAFRGPAQPSEDFVQGDRADCCA